VTTTVLEPRVLATVEQLDNSLGENQRDVLFHPFTHAYALVRLGIIPKGDVDPDLVVTDFNREHADIVRPRVESPSSGQVEAGMMPMAGQNAVLYAAAIEWKPHVRTAVVYGVDSFSVSEEDNRVAVDVDDRTSGPPNVGKIRGAFVLCLRRWRSNFSGGPCNLVPQALEVVAQVLADLIPPIRILLQATLDDPGEMTRQIHAQLGDRNGCIPEN